MVALAMIDSTRIDDYRDFLGTVAIASG